MTRTDLHFALSEGRLVDACRLLATGEALASDRDCFGATPLHWASYEGHEPSVRWLMEQAGANVHDANVFGDTPLHSACGEGEFAVAHDLLLKGSDPHQPNLEGHSATDYAKRANVDPSAWLNQAKTVIGKNAYKPPTLLDSAKRQCIRRSAVRKQGGTNLLSLRQLLTKIECSKLIDTCEEIGSWSTEFDSVDREGEWQYTIIDADGDYRCEVLGPTVDGIIRKLRVEIESDVSAAYKDAKESFCHWAFVRSYSPNRRTSKISLCH
jgi:hypothetical protein